ncbi:MAG: FIST N-terminal domain-containing protein [Cyanobacteria bacterium J06632_3]
MGTQAGVGISHHRNPHLAGQLAAELALRQADIDQPDFVLMFASVGYPQQALVQSVRKATSHAPLCGCSGEGIITNGVADESNFSVAVMVIKSDEMTFQRGFSLGLSQDPLQVGQSVGDALEAHIHPDNQALFVFADGLTFNFDKFLEGLTSQVELNQSLPIFGGASADNWELSKTYQYCDDQVFSDGVTWALLSGRTQLAWAVNHGCVPIGGRKTVTRAVGNVIYEIDGKPALKVLEEYLSSDEIDNWQRTVINLCLGFKAPSHLKSYDEYLIRFIPTKDDETASITIQTEVDEGTGIWMTRRDHDKISRGVENMAASLQEQLAGATPKMIFQFDCCGRGNVVFRNQQKVDLLNRLQQQIGSEIPWIGLYTLGEIGPVNGSNCFHNYTAVLTAVY